MNAKVVQKLKEEKLDWYYHGKTCIIRVPVQKYNRDRDVQDRVTFLCPFCMDKYNKNGDPRINSRRTWHLHGWDKGEDMTTRTPHCKPEAREWWSIQKDFFQFQLEKDF